jgi:hypothetical protein
MQNCLELMRRNIWAITVLGVAFLYESTVFNRGLSLGDDGNIIMSALRVLDGQVPFRDFEHFFYAPGSVYLVAFLYRLFGESYLLLRAVWAVVQSFSILLVFVISSRFVPKVLALLPAAIMLLMPGPWFKAFYPFFSLLTYYGIARYLDQPSRRSACVLGFLCAMALLFRQDIGIWASILSFASIALTRLVARPKSWRDFWTEELCLVGIAVALVLPFLIYMQVQGALIPMLEELLIKVPSLTRSNWKLSLQGVFSLWREAPLFFCFFVFHYVFPFFAFFLLKPSSASRSSQKHLLVLLVLNLLVIFPSLVFVGLIRILQANHFNTILSVLFLHRLAQAARGLPPKSDSHLLMRNIVRIAVYLFMLACPLFYILKDYDDKGQQVATALYSSNFKILYRQNRALSIRGERIYVTDKLYTNVTKNLEKLPQYAQPGDSVFFLPAASIYNYLTDYVNPTKFIGIWTFLYDDRETAQRISADLIAELDKHKVKFVVCVWNQIFKIIEGEAAQRTFKEHYVMVQQRPFQLYQRVNE